jgi:nucleoside-diphosphate-sugar epimerase
LIPEWLGAVAPLLITLVCPIGRLRIRNRRRPRVVLTGAAGLIGGILREGLVDRYELFGLDLRRDGGVDAVVDMTNLGAIQAAFGEADAMIDLAADPSADASWETVRENNIPATLNALTAAHQAGVSRVVFASSNHVVGRYEHDEPYASIVAGRYQGIDPGTFVRINSQSPIRPDGPYAVGKALGEAAGRYFSEVHGVSTICLRIGTVNRENRPLNERQFATLLTHRDLIQLVDRSLAAPASLEFAVLYGVSENMWRIWDIEEARRAIGFEPDDNAEQWR